MAYTKIPKPGATPYTNINTIGKQQYDQADIAYDDSSVFYDGINVGAYTKLAKPVTASYTKIPKPV